MKEFKDKGLDHVQLLNFSEIENYGKEHPVDLNPPNSEDIAVIMYTSGTTGIII